MTQIDTYSQLKHESMLHTTKIKIKINRLWENICYLGEMSGTTIRCPTRKTSLSATHLVTGVIRLCPWCFLVVSLVDSLVCLLIFMIVISRYLHHKACIPMHLWTLYMYSYRSGPWECYQAPLPLPSLFWSPPSFHRTKSCYSPVLDCQSLPQPCGWRGGLQPCL